MPSDGTACLFRQIPEVSHPPHRVDEARPLHDDGSANKLYPIDT